MREYEKRASRIGLLVVVAALVAQVISNEIPSVNISLAMKLMIAVVIGAISFLIMEWAPKILINQKSLCGLYIIAYDDNKNNLCSIVNIEQDKQREKYLIDVYDCYLQDSCWLSVEKQYPINLDSIFYDLSPRGVHLVSNNDDCKACIFIRFTYGTNTGYVTRYGLKKPFNKPYTGLLKKLTSGQLCEVFNSQYNNENFCNMLLSKHTKCKSEGRMNCQQKENVVLDKVRAKGHYLEIAKVLYYSIVGSADPSGIPKSKRSEPKNKPASGSGVGTVKNSVKGKPEKDQFAGEADITKPEHETAEAVICTKQLEEL